MPTPTDYSLNIPNPSQAFMQGMQNGMGIQENQLKMQQQQAALQQQQLQQKALADFRAKPNKTADDYADATLAMPGMREQFKQAWEMKNPAQKDEALSSLSQWSAAIKNGKPEIASSAMRARADALESGGQPNKDAITLRHQADMVDAHPEFANAVYLTPMLMSHPDGKRLVDNITAMGAEGRAAGLAPAALKKATAEARGAVATADTAEVTAANAPTSASLGNQKVAQDIRASQLSGKVSELNAQIAASNSETDRGRLTLERDKLTAEQAKLGIATANTAQDGMDALVQGLQTVKSIKEHPGLMSSWGLGGVGSTSGKISGIIPGTDRKDLEGLVDTLKSQQFLAGVKQLTGMGSLSNAEGEKIGSAVASLNMDQSPTAFRNAIGVIEKHMTKAQQKTTARGQLPTAGGAYVATVPGIGVVDEGHINQVLKANPGATREQVIQFMQSRGGK